MVDKSDQVPPERVQGRVDGGAPQAGGFAAVARERDTAASQVSRAVDRPAVSPAMARRVGRYQRTVYATSECVQRQPPPAHPDALAEALGSSSGPIKATAP